MKTLSRVLLHSMHLVMTCKTLCICCLLIAIWSCDEGETKNEATHDGLFSVIVANDGRDSLESYGIDIDLVRVNESFKLMHRDGEIPTQIEDRNSNSTPDRVFAQLDLPAGSIKNLVAIPGSPTTSFDKEVMTHAYVNGSAIERSYTFQPDDEWKDGGIILETGLIAYRALMSDRFAFDIVGKRQEKMLKALGKYDLSTIDSWGGDALEEGSSLGIGSPALFDQDKIVFIDNFDSRQVEIIVEGPLRAEVHITVRGVIVRNEKIDLRIKWQMHANKPWSQIDIGILTRTDLNLEFAFGLPRHPDATDFTQGLIDNVHFAYTYGLQSSEGEQLGLAVMVPGRYEMDTYRDDDHNYFYLVEQIDRSVQYRILAAWGKGRQEIHDEIMFMDLVRKYTAEYGAEVRVQPDFGL